MSSERKRQFGRERVARFRDRAKNKNARRAYIIKEFEIDDPDAWRQVAAEWGMPSTMSLDVATPRIINLICHDLRKEQAENLMRGIGPIRTGYLEREPPQKDSRLIEKDSVARPSKPPTPVLPMTDDQRRLSVEGEMAREHGTYEGEGADAAAAEPRERGDHDPDWGTETEEEERERLLPTPDPPAGDD